jgi:predicted ATPase
MSLWLQRVEIRGDEFPDRTRYPFNVAPLQGSQRLDLTRSVVFLVGENGCGKSTLIQAVARRCGLHLWGQPTRRLGSGELSAAALSQHLGVTVTEGNVTGGLFSAETFREWAEFIDDVTRLDPGQARYYGGTELTARSHGQGILAYLAGRYSVPGLYFLDEPESALSPASQLELLKILARHRASGHTQFVIATHSPILLALPESQILLLTGEGIRETEYEATDHYRLYRDFLEDRNRFLP